MKTTTKKYNILADYIIKNLKRGDLLTHRQIETIIDIPRKKDCGDYNTSYQYNLKMTNEILKKKAFRIMSIKGVGYRVMTFNDYIDTAINEYNTGVRMIDNSINTLDSISHKKSRFSRPMRDRYEFTHNSIASELSHLNILNSDGVPY